MTFSQDYYPLIEENKTWNVISVILVGPYQWDTTYSTITYEFSGDTIIDSQTYLKLYESNEEFPANWNLWCYMREDNDKRIWYRRDSDDDEMLMYDFSVEAGDSVLVGLFEPVYLTIDSINTIYINQADRKKYWLSCKTMPEYRETWFEGVGSNKGLCWGSSVYIVGGWCWFLCMSENEELIYMNPNYEACYLITEINEIDKPTIKIYPNPVKNLFRIENIKNIEIESISLTNINGQIIKRFDSRKTQLDISEITSGLYFLKISYKNGELTKKIMIE